MINSRFFGLLHQSNNFSSLCCAIHHFEHLNMNGNEASCFNMNGGPCHVITICFPFCVVKFSPKWLTRLWKGSAMHKNCALLGSSCKHCCKCLSLWRSHLFRFHEKADDEIALPPCCLHFDRLCCCAGAAPASRQLPCLEEEHPPHCYHRCYRRCY